MKSIRKNIVIEKQYYENIRQERKILEMVKI